MFELACYGQARIFDANLVASNIALGVGACVYLIVAIAAACAIGLALKKICVACDLE